MKKSNQKIKEYCLESKLHDTPADVFLNLYLNANEESAKIKVAVHFSGLADAQAKPKIYKRHYFNECFGQNIYLMHKM